jgi:PAS domain S-box-containing protein
MNEGAVTVSGEGIILYCNKSFAELLNIPLEKIIGTPLLDYSEQGDSEKLKYFLESPVPSKDEINFLRKDGPVVSLYLSKTQLRIEDMEPVFCIIATDLTEKKKNEEILAAEKLARSILEQAGEAIVVCDDEMQIIRANKAAEELAGESVLFKKFENVFPLYDKNKNKISVLELTDNDSSSVEAAILRKNEAKIHLIINVGKLNGQHDHTLGYVINLTNITNHILVEEKLSASLKEKTILLKEIHHRVKNNLQIISSLLNLQASGLKEESLISVLTECRNRVTSMALIHQKLYESKSFTSISIPAYLKEMIPSLSSSYQIKNCKVELDLPAADIVLTIEAAIPLGLIMNELVTNSLKHSLKHVSNGEICISLKLLDGNNIEIKIYDNGPGFPEDVDFYNPATLGLQLVQTLVKQLNGSIELEEKKGTRIKIVIPRA